MKTFVFAVAAALLSVAPAVAQQPAPAPLQSPNAHYVVIPLEIDVKAPVDKVWARIGKYCDIGEWGIPNCTILSGDGGFGTVRSVGNEILVAKTKYSYTYTQPVRTGVTYNLYHGTLEAVPASATTTKLHYTLVYDDSMLPSDTAKKAAADNRRMRFGKMLENMKTLCEGGKLAPDALNGLATAAPAK
jgi:hypothetical protein